MAEELFQQNNINQEEWRHAVLCSLQHGRSKGTLVCHAGLKGNEGKSFLLAPLMVVFGADSVFTLTSKTGFPLMGLEACRLALLDDWRFNEDLIGYPLQLLWFEGKPIVIARPQNQHSGHLRYRNLDPIFITTLETDITKLRGKKLESGDVEMMLRRLKIFRFHTELTSPVKVQECGCCFAKLLLGAPVAAQPKPRGPAGYSTHHTPPNLARQEDVQRPANNLRLPIARQEHVQAREHSALPVLAGEAQRSKRQAEAWGVTEVLDYLDSLGLGHVKEKFLHDAVDGQFLSTLSEIDLVAELGLTRLQARKVLSRLP